jgi:lambda repressor-like predicted transcriptional regulator
MKVQRNANSPVIRSVRPMVRADLELLRQPSARARIAKLRDSHHIMARLFVSGLTLAEVASETGYSIARVSVLRNSPAMQELIAKYRDDDHDEWRKHRDGTYEYMHRVRMKAVRLIEDALDEDEVKPEFALKVFDSMADRTEYHRKSTKENINIDFAARLEVAIARSAKVIDANRLDD